MATARGVRSEQRNVRSYKVFRIFPVTGVDPQMTFEVAVGEPGDSRTIDADQVQKTMQQIYEHLRVEMRRSQDIMEEGANRR